MHKLTGRIELATGDSEEEVEACKFFINFKFLTLLICIDSKPAELSFEEMVERERK